MDVHVRNLGVISIVFGILSTLGAITCLIWFDGFRGVFHYAEDVAGLGFIAVFSVAAHLTFGLPLAASGYFVTHYHQWARVAMIVLCGINVLNIPFGSLLAIYGLWALLTPETEPLFSEPPNRNIRPAR